MPARNSSMELSSPSNPDTGAGLQPSRRKSGRNIKQTEHLSPSQDVSTKRKHASLNGDARKSTPESEEEEDDDDGEPDEEELREQRRKARKTSSGKPAAKGTKKKAISGAIPVRSAPARAKHTKRTAPAAVADAEEAGGLYAELFGNDLSVEAVAGAWNARFDEHQSDALAEVVNLVLRASGCEIEVDLVDIEDPDNAPSKLTDIQDAFQKKEQRDYPLISKGKGTAQFKRTLVAFFEALIRTLAASGLLYTNRDLMENIQVWIGSMSSAVNRPFRHTTTVVSLAMMDGLCSVGKSLVETQARFQRQIEGEEKKTKVNRQRIEAIRQQAEEEAMKAGTVNEIAKDLFDGVFVHRYRDVDEKIRVECVAHLSNWITTYSDRFLDGTFIRYLGWLLSDPSPLPRHETVKQLQKMYKEANMLNGFQAFTERFKDRMIEMATRDAEPGIRASTVELLDTLRAAGVLEPHDIDSVGRLIFDAEPRVRKAVVPFFEASVQEIFEDKKVECGGEDALEEGMPAADDDDLERPRVEWLKLKALAELLVSFEPEETPPNVQPGSGSATEALNPSGLESRCTLAAQSLFTFGKDLPHWHALAGYLLFDGSQPRDDAWDTGELFRQQTQIIGREEAILLDLLGVSVKLSVTDIVHEGKEKNKKSKKDQQALQEKQEAAAQTLASVIPKLLNKFGASPQSASAVLRVQQTLRLDIFQELRQDSTTFAALLDDIQKQFMSHKTSDVLYEASNAFLHARQFEGLDEFTDERLQSLWDESAYALVMHCRGEELETRGMIDEPTLANISNTVLRLASLARVSDCTAAFTTPKTYKAKNNRRKSGSERPTTPLSLLLAMVSRGQPVPSLEPDISEIEDELTVHTIEALLLYFTWQAYTLKSSPTTPTTTESLEPLATTFSTYSDTLYTIIDSPTHELRTLAASTLLDLHSTFHIADSPSTAFTAFQSMIPSFSQPKQANLLKLFGLVEKEYAKRAGKKLEDPADDEEPEDPEDSSDEQSDEEEEELTPEEAAAKDARRTAKHRATLLAEHKLCSLAGKFTFAIVTGALDTDAPEGEAGPVRKRLTRNKNKIGGTFAQVLALLEEPAREKKAKVKREVERAKEKRREKRKALERKVQEREEDEVEDVEDEGDEQVGEDEEALRRRGLVVEEEIAGRDLEGAGEGEGEVGSGSREVSVVGD